MKLVLKGIGTFLLVFGLVDLLGSFSEFDLWGEMGIQLPDLLWKYSSYVEMLAGYFIFNAGKIGKPIKSET